jgi:hypothetical protein
MTRLTIDYDGEPDGLRRELRNAFRLVEREEPGPEPVDQRVTIRVTDQPSPARSPAMGTTSMRSDQLCTIDPDFKGRLSGKDVDLAVTWSSDDPESIATFEVVPGDGDSSIGRLVATPGSGGIVTVTWSAQNGDELLTGSETFEIAGEAVVFAGQTVEVSDQPAA